MAWGTYHPPSVTLPITALLAITRTNNSDLLLRLISYPQSDGENPRVTATVSDLSAFMQMSDPIPMSMFTVGNIKFNKTRFYNPISKPLYA